MAVPVAALALSSMAFAAPGVSPPCDQADQAPAARTTAGARGSAAWQGDSQNWVTIRDGRLLVFHDGFAPRLTGQGQLGIRDGGRRIELKEGQRLLVNGREPRDDRIVEVCETMSLAIVDRDGQTLWRIEPVRVAREDALGMRAESADAEWSAAARAAEAAEAEADRPDSADDDMDTADAEEIARNATEISRAAVEMSQQITSQVTSSVLPQVAQLREMGMRLGASLAPRLAGISAKMVGQVVPSILQGLCDGGLCDDSVPRAKRHKVFKPRP